MHEPPNVPVIPPGSGRMDEIDQIRADIARYWAAEEAERPVRARYAALADEFRAYLAGAHPHPGADQPRPHLSR